MNDAAVFLDRDGVINDVVIDGGVVRGARRLSEFRLNPEAHGVLLRLHEAGFLLIVVSNQPDVARGEISLGDVEAISTRIQETFPITAVYTCLHDNSDGCDCRKPAPGLIVRAASEWDLDLTKSWLIGDRWVDIAAARNAGVAPILLSAPHSWEPTSAGAPNAALRTTRSAESLARCADIILAERRP